MRLLLLLAAILVPALLIGIVLSAVAGSQATPKKNVIVLKPSNTQKTTTVHTPTSNSNNEGAQWVKINTPSGVLMFYATQLTQFEIRNDYIIIGFNGELKLGPGTYTFYNISNCKIGGDIEILGISKDRVTIHAIKDMYVKDCGLVVLRLAQS